MDQYFAHKTQLFTAFTKVLGIEVQFSAPYHKTEMGLCERANGLVGRWLKSYMVTHQRDCDATSSPSRVRQCGSWILPDRFSDAISAVRHTLYETFESLWEDRK